MEQLFLSLLFITDLNSINSMVGMLILAVSALVSAIIYLYMDSKAERKESKLDRELTLKEYKELSRESTHAITSLTTVVREVKEEIRDLRVHRQ
jgi:hypothetical protein